MQFLQMMIATKWWQTTGAIVTNIGRTTALTDEAEATTPFGQAVFALIMRSQLSRLRGVKLAHFHEGQQPTKANDRLSRRRMPAMIVCTDEVSCSVRLVCLLKFGMRKKVLLVDDQMLDVALTRQALADCSIEHEIVAAFDGFEGLNQLRAQEFDVVLLDLKMPKVNGFEVLEQMRKHPRLSNTPVIVLSNSVLEVDRSRAEALGAVEFVPKALEYSEFKHDLKSALGRHGFC